MAEYWLITAPADTTAEQTWSRLDQKVRRDGDMATTFRFKIPDLRVGTLDVLQALCEDFVKIDSSVETVFKKFDRTLMELTGKDEPPQIEGKPLDAYLTDFKWNDSKFPVSRSLKELIERIQAEVTTLDDTLKKRATEYSSIRTQLGALQRRDQGNLLVRDLTPYVRAEHSFETDTLTTLYLAIPRFAYKDWQNKYESFKVKVAGETGERDVSVVVPRSSQGPLHEDQEYGLFTVVMFKRFLDDFKHWARENRFNIRDFRFDRDSLKRSDDAREKLIAEERTKKSQFVVWLQTAYAEVFSRWVHLKAIRAFVESVLRYGLPPDFMSCVVVPKRGQEKRLRAALGQLYAHLAGAGLATSEEESTLHAAAGLQEYFPYVYLNINLKK